MTDKVHQYAGDGFTLTFDRSRCLHAEACVRGAPLVFDPRRRRWIDPLGADVATVAAVVVQCPTGALHYTRQDGGPEEAADSVNRVRVDPDGPLYLRGDIRVEREDGVEILHDTRVALCRCGRSARKPFCDGSHTAAGFSDGGNVAGESEVSGGADDGPLVVTVLAGAALRASGPMEIVAADHTVIVRQRASFCRCGASGRKPFCDGSHGPAGFAAR